MFKVVREFYPELFDFKDFEMRLKVYAVEHDLKTLLDWSISKDVKKMIANTISYSGLKSGTQTKICPKERPRSSLGVISLMLKIGV